MKRPEFNKEPISQKFRLAEPMKRPLMSATPTILSHPLHPNDSFLIFASDGLWEHLTNEKAVEIVHNHPRAVSFFLNFSLRQMVDVLSLPIVLYCCSSQ